MTRLLPLLGLVLFLGGCSGAQQGTTGTAGGKGQGRTMSWTSPLEARKGFQTKLLRQEREQGAVAEPPPGQLRLIRYDAPAGKLAAYVSVPPQDGMKHPAILWVCGGFSNSIGETAWQPGEPDNDQSASAFWKAGVVTMYPSFRGGAGNPGFKEGFLGEVNDLLAAAEWLAQQEYVDPQRIYLGGHSTGGTLVLLAAAFSNRFRAVFSFGPIHDISEYGAENLPFDINDERELDVRNPILWLHAIRSPTYVLEGVAPPSNWGSLRELAEAETKNTALRFHPVANASHFSILGPATRLLAEKIRGDAGTEPLTLTEEELGRLFNR